MSFENSWWYDKVLGKIPEYIIHNTGPILESKGMHVIFQKKGKKGQEMFKKEQQGAKYLKIWVKMYKI